MSLVEDLMREMQQMKDANEEMKKKLQNSSMDVSSGSNSCQFLTSSVFVSLHVTGPCSSHQRAELLILV